MRAINLVGAVALGLGFMWQPAEAAVTILDTGSDAFLGGLPTQNYGQRDVIGSTSVFEIFRMDIGRLSTGEAHVKIWTNYVGNNGNLGTHMGDLLFHVNDRDAGDVWSPQGSGPDYSGDEFDPTGSAFDEWNFAVQINRQVDAATGQAVAYTSDLLAITDGDIVTSNEEMAAAGRANYIYRNNQAVAVDGGTVAAAGAAQVTLSNKVLGSTEKFIEFIINDGGLLTDDFAVSWALTCGNDIIQGDYPPAVSEPASLSVLALGMVGLGALRRRRQRRTVSN